MSNNEYYVTYCLEGYFCNSLANITTYHLKMFLFRKHITPRHIHTYVFGTITVSGISDFALQLAIVSFGGSWIGLIIFI